jgi:hypothetical protein
MRMSGAILLSAMALAACGERQEAPPFFAIPQATAVQSRAEPAGVAPLVPMTPSPNPEVQEFLQGHPEDVGRGPAPVPRPSAATQPFYTQPPNVGPVTGYGPGGMVLPPGAPPNPPYH